MNEVISEAERLARDKHRQRQRDGHHTPSWDGLSDLMKAELIYQEMISNVDCGISKRIIDQ
jgi:hypothetical protein